jgi:hypothetical protein
MLVQAAEGVDQHENWKGNAKHPQQQITSHDISPPSSGDEDKCVGERRGSNAAFSLSPLFAGRGLR